MANNCKKVRKVEFYYFFCHLIKYKPTKDIEPSCKV